MAVIQENLDAATDQIAMAVASGSSDEVRSTLAYWFGIVYDEAARTSDTPEDRGSDKLKMVTEGLRDMSERLAGSLEGKKPVE